MTAAGLAKIEAAKKNGAWSSYDSVDSLVVPADLAKALEKNRRAKRAPTRAARIAETVRLAAKNVRANHWRQPTSVT